MQDNALNQSLQQVSDYLNMGLTFEEKEEYQKAIDAYNKGLKKFPDEKEFHQRLACLYLNKREKGKALEHFSKYLEENDQININTAVIYGSLVADLHGTKKAIEYLNKLNHKLNRSEIETFIQELEKNENPTTPPEPGLEEIKFSSTVVADLFDLFSGRENNYAIQWVDNNKSGYSPANEPMSFQTAARHLKGEITLGVYQLNAASQVKWCAFDVDIKKHLVDQKEKEGKNINFLLYQALMVAKELKQVVEARELNTYIEFSGNKGYHVWIFFETFISAKKAKQLMTEILEQANFGLLEHVVSVEIFPKQVSLENEKKLGNLVKLPLGIHKKTGKRSYFLDENDKPIPHLSGFFKIAKKNTLEKLKSISDKQESIKPDQPLEISDMVKDSSITMSDAELNLLMSRCRIIDFIINKIVWEKECTDDEFNVVKHTVGHLKNGKNLVNTILVNLKNADQELKLKKNLTGYPMGCKKIKLRVPDIAVRFDCNCKFSPDLKEYKHPVLHIKEFDLEQEELSKQRAEALKFQHHLEKYLEVKKEIKEKVELIKSIEKYLNRYMNEKDIEELKTEFGVLKRITHPNGETALVMEL
jgi:hypothetical protein